MNALPIDPHIDRIVAEVRRARAMVITAAPGAGKTTRVPPALVADGPLILLQPRRVAARAIAARIAEERGWTLGREVGWQIRFERTFTKDTQLLVVTEGILTARLQSDPLLSDFRTIVIDEFHERGVHADLAIALARQAWRARDDLRLVVMSATLESESVAAFLDGCPIVDVPGRQHPIDVAYAPGVSVAASVDEALRASPGDVLCFLPGAAEIRRAIAEVESSTRDIEIVPLHGSLDADAQDRALRPSPRRRVIVATNIAETSLTVPGVTAVIDSGLHKVARYDAGRGSNSLDTERITADAADQRAGRAGRTAPGIVRRLWDARDRLRPHREPDILRIDLTGPILDVIAWGGDPRMFEWFERPREDALETALTLLVRLELIESHGAGRAGRAGRAGGAGGAGWQLTAIGERARRLPLHPRLARILIAGAGTREVARACALLSERHLLPARSASTTSDLLSAIDDWDAVPAHVQRTAAQIADFGLRIADLKAPSKPDVPAARTPRPVVTNEALFRKALLAGYPDRVAQRREARSPNVLLATGTGATIAPESGVHDGEFVVAIDVNAATARPEGRALQPRHVGHGLQPVPTASNDPRIRIASIVDRAWLRPTATDIVHLFDADSGTVKARRVERYDALVLSEHPTTADPEIAAELLAAAWHERGPGDEDERVLRRVQFAGHEIDVTETVQLAAHGARRLADVHLARALSVAVLRDLDRDAPDTLSLPSGRHARLEYNADGTVSASVKLQELFGLAETPCIGRRHEPLVLALLAPNGRPVQITSDLRSFWDRTYPEVRKELRGRYPKHPWPEDPWKATPTAKARQRK